MNYTKSATIERAREVAQRVRDRNNQTWDELDREIVFAFEALIASAEHHRLRHYESPVAHMFGDKR